MSDNSFFETDFENNPENNSDSRGANLEEGKNSLKSNQNADQETEIEGLGLNTLEDKVEPNILETVMQSSYLNYAMSVIVSRALPDVRDGLKPVHRRVIYVMNRLGLTPGAKYKKSAQVVGEVLGKFHPHGDVAVYDSLVRMAQEFSLRYPLVDGQGNFGSIDGDSAAAMRYTECRLNRPAVYLTQDLDKDTVDFVDNYDGSQKEPEVLPNLFPNLLVNGSTGIAVGMATSIPPHNLHEVSRAILHLLDNPEAEAQDLMEFIKGPDLPTGGIIYGQNDILQAYQTGRGKCTVRSKARLEEDRIVITEIPYQINKAVMIEKMADLVRDKKVEGIRDIRDESNKQGIRIVIEVKRDVSPEVVLNLLYKQTDLQVNLHFNLVALIKEGRQPKVLTLKEILQEFLAHRFKIIVRRTQYELNKNKAELHILDGLKLALDFIEEVIKIIRGSFDKQEAAEKLQKRFELSDKQTEAILQMRLQTLTSLDKNKIEDQRQKLLAEIIELQKILDHESVRKDLVKSELEDLLSRFSSERRSQIVVHGVEDYNKEDFITEETVLVQLTQQQYLKVMPMDLLRQQGRGGKGVSSFNAKDEDWVRQSFVASTHDVVYAFTNSGRVFRSRVFDLPGGSRTGRGQNLVNYFELKDGEKITNILTINKDQEAEKIGDLIFATEKGIVKRTALEEYQNVNRKGIIAIGLKDGDRLVDVGHSGENSDNIILSADNGKTVIFSKESLSQIGRAGQGVKGIRLKNQDKLISLQISQFDFTEGEEE